MRQSWELGNESLFRMPPNFSIWLLAKKYKNKIKNSPNHSQMQNF